MQVGLLEMPADGVWVARYEEEKAPGYTKKDLGRKAKKWVVYNEQDEAVANYYTKEAAMCRLLMGMFETQAIQRAAREVA